MQNDLVTNYNLPINQSTVINNPLDVEKVVNLSKDEINYPFPKTTVRLLSVGRLSIQKRYDMLLKSMVKLDKKYTLTLVGDGDKEDELRALVKELGLEDRVHFALYQANPYPYMKEADIFVLSSRYEGLPNVILEANACGTPAAAFGCPGIDGVVEEGKNGFLAACMDSDKLAEKIEETLAYSFEAEKVREMISKKYNKELILHCYEERLLELINTKRG
jgi:glycosyltransferase involved in cell wall biosynthesis